MVWSGGLVAVAVVVAWLARPGLAATFNQYSRADLLEYREEVRAMFQHSYDSYLQHAYPYDELRPLSCDGVDTWGSYSLTLIDALDTLAVMGNYSEFGRVYGLLAERRNFDANINVSVFETNIRIVGGLLSAHLLARRAGVELEPGWPCAGPLLRLAEDAASRLLPAFHTPTGMPYGTVNLRHGVPAGETPVTCTAGVSTYIVEFGTLSRLTGNPLYEETALRALRALWHHRSDIGLLGNHIDVLKGKWTAVEAGIGAGVDSYFEYLVKGATLLQRPELMTMFRLGREGVDQYLKKDDWHFWVNMKNGQVTMPLFQNLEAFWPGTLSMVGDTEAALKSLHNYHQVWKQYGFTPEFYNVAQGGVAANREGYPLRPELIESIVYLYRATGDPWLVDAGLDILRSIQHSAWTPCGYATVKNVLTHSLEDRMESFFLAETTKYLYLLFDPDNFLHNRGTQAEAVETEHGTCMMEAGGYIFNTEAHPIDPAALACCSGPSQQELQDMLTGSLVDILQPGRTTQQYRGDTVQQRVERQAARRAQQSEERAAREAAVREQLEQLRRQAEQAAAQHKAREEERKRKLAELQESMQNHSQEQGEEKKDEEEEEQTGEVGEDAEDDLEDEEMEAVADGEDSPQFSEKKEAGVAVDPELKEAGQQMISKQSTGETLSPGIVTPAIMENPLERKPNVVVQVISELVKRFLPAESRQYDEDSLAAALEEEQWPLDQDWYTDHNQLSCPAFRFTDRFLFAGEFWPDEGDTP